MDQKGGGSGSATLVNINKSPYLVFLDITSCRRRCHSRIFSLTRGPRSGWVVCEVDAERAAAVECGADLAAAVAAGAVPEGVPAAAADPLGGRLSVTPAYVWLYSTVSVYRYIPKYLSRWPLVPLCFFLIPSYPVCALEFGTFVLIEYLVRYLLQTVVFCNVGFFFSDLFAQCKETARSTIPQRD
jgi:hypothetical protein